MKRILSTLILLPALPLLAPPAQAQVSSALFRETDPLPGAPGQTISAIGSAACNQAGGYAARATSIGGTPTSHFVGAVTGGAPVVLQSALSGVAGYNQTGLEDFFGMGDLGELGYSPTCTDLATLVTGLDCAWQDSTPIAVEEDPIPTLPGKKYRFNSRVGMAGNGTIYWIGGINDVATNLNEGQGLFVGASATVLLKTGDPSPAPLVSVLGSSAASFTSRMSANATNWITEIDTTDATTADAHLVINGAIAMDAGGSRMSEGQLVSAAAGGNGVELWQGFGSLGINEAGDWFCDGDTNAATTADGVLVKNGVILMREGQNVDGVVLSGNALSSGSYMNEDGDIATTWLTVGSLEALFVNGELVLLEGQMVDWDGDGVLDPNTAVTDFTGIAAVVVGPRTTSAIPVYFTADVNVGGIVMEGFFQVDVPLDNFGGFCFGDGTQLTPCPCANDGAPGHGCNNSIGTGGALLSGAGSVSPDAVVLTCTDAIGSALSIFLQGSAAGPGVSFGDGVRCAAGLLKRLYVKNASGGTVSAPEPGDPSITTISAILGDTIVPGSTRYYQVYYRDPDALFCPEPAGSSFNVSNAISIFW